MSKHRQKTPAQASSTLSDVLAAALEGAGSSRKDLTVLSPQVDPYRFNTPAGHRDGAWVAKQLLALWTPGKKFHWRGLHYAMVQSKTQSRSRTARSIGTLRKIGNG